MCDDNRDEVQDKMWDDKRDEVQDKMQGDKRDEIRDKMQNEIQSVLTNWEVLGTAKQIYSTAWAISDEYVLKAYDNLEQLKKKRPHADAALPDGYSRSRDYSNAQRGNLCS